MKKADKEELKALVQAGLGQIDESYFGGLQDILLDMEEILSEEPRE